MTDKNKDVPIPKKRMGSTLITLESFERHIPIEVFFDDPTKREKFRKAFESEKAIAFREQVMVLYGSKHWKTIDEFQELASTAAKQREEGREFLSGIFALTESDIKKAREELGGRIALMIQQKKFNELDAIFKAIQKAPEQEKRAAAIYLSIFDYIKENERLPTAEKLRSFYNDKKKRKPRDPDMEPDPSNFSKVLKKLGFGGLPKHR